MNTILKIMDCFLKLVNGIVILVLLTILLMVIVPMIDGCAEIISSVHHFAIKFIPQG
jgi:hypothetical protein